MPVTKKRGFLSLRCEICLICHTDLCVVPVYF